MALFSAKLVFEALFWAWTSRSDPIFVKISLWRPLLGIDIHQSMRFVAWQGQRDSTQSNGGCNTDTKHASNSTRFFSYPWCCGTACPCQRIFEQSFTWISSASNALCRKMWLELLTTWSLCCAGVTWNVDIWNMPNIASHVSSTWEAEKKQQAIPPTAKGGKRTCQGAKCTLQTQPWNMERVGRFDMKKSADLHHKCENPWQK